MDTIVVICTIIVALVYIIWTFYKSQKDQGQGGCGCGSHKGGCTGCGGKHHRKSTGTSTGKDSKDTKANIQLKRKQLKLSIF